MLPSCSCYHFTHLVQLLVWSPGVWMSIIVHTFVMLLTVSSLQFWVRLVLFVVNVNVVNDNLAGELTWLVLFAVQQNFTCSLRNRWQHSTRQTASCTCFTCVTSSLYRLSLYVSFVYFIWLFSKRFSLF